MLAGFQLNLQAMSLVSLLVGMFLIYNTIEASVVRRRSEIGILRSLGVTRREIRLLFLGEASVLGAVGIAVGMAGGYLLARWFVGTVAETISSLYVLLSVQQVVVSPWNWISALLLGFASVMAAAWFPARAAAFADMAASSWNTGRRRSAKASALVALAAEPLALVFRLAGTLWPLGWPSR